MIGAGLELWAQKFAAAAGKNLLKVTLSDGLPLIRSAEPAHEHANEADDSAHRPPIRPDPAAGAVIANPHIWLDPVMAQSMVGPMVSVLSGMDAAQADQYRRQGQIYINRCKNWGRSLASRIALKKSFLS
jgi:ABC-type Zn uptake system ZnuABC Zn-binding protein ZnuA